MIEDESLNLNENFVELSEVQKIAESLNFSTNKAKKKSISKNNEQNKNVKEIKEIKNNSQKVNFYIINYVEGGFVLLSADKRTQPILGFSDKGNFSLEDKDIPEGLQFWVNDAKKQISDIQNSQIKQSKKEKKAWDEEGCTENTETITVGPLLNTTWHQQGGFNDALPYITCNSNPYQVLAGCVPIAMAQVMKYHEYPTSYNWSSMPNTYGTTTTANLISDLHTEISTMYGGSPNPLSYSCTPSTGVSAGANMGSVLKNDFNYTTADWASYNYQTVKSDITYGKPVILSGSNTSSGHMWVADGHKTITYTYEDCYSISYLYFNMNWGWYGSSDGWFAFDNFNPNNTYNNNKKMIYNITP